MTTEQMLTSVELSLKLREAGASQKNIKGPFPSRFCCAELLERLPDTLPVEIETGHPYFSLGCIAGRYQAGYFIDGVYRAEYANTPAEALGELYLWCLENGYAKEVE